MRDECARAAFDSERDPAGTLYGFSREEWTEAAARNGGTAASVVAFWDEIMRWREAGDVQGADLEALVAVARLSPGHARRVIARLEPAFSRDYGPLAAAIGPDGRVSPEYLARRYPEVIDDAERNPRWLAQLTQELLHEHALVEELRALAAASDARPD